MLVMVCVGGIGLFLVLGLLVGVFWCGFDYVDVIDWVGGYV